MPAEYTTPHHGYKKTVMGRIYFHCTKLQATSRTGKIFTKQLSRIQYLETKDHMAANSQFSGRIAINRAYL